MKPVVVALLLLAFALCCATPVFQTTDDVYLYGTASGYWTGQPSEFLVFTHVWLGLIFKHLYTQWPAVNWYVWLQIAVQALSVGVLVRTLAHKMATPRLALSAAVVATLVLLLPFLLWPQYTQVAFLVGTAGWVLWLNALGSPTLAGSPAFTPAVRGTLGPSVTSCRPEGRPTAGVNAGLPVGLLLISLSALIRSEVFVGLTALALPLFLWEMHTRRRYRVLVWPALAGALFYTFNAAESRYYTLHAGQPDWKQYQIALDALVSGPNHWEHGQQTNNNFGTNDLQLIRQWWYLPAEDPPSRERILQAGAAERRTRTPTEALRYAATQLADHWHLLLTAGILTLLAGARRARKWQWLLLLGALLAQWTVLAFVSRLPQRVVGPELCACFFLLMAVLPPRSVLFDFQTQKWRAGLLGVALVVALLNVFKKEQLARTLRREWAQYERTMATHPQQLFVFVGGYHNWEGIWSWRNPALRSTHNALPLGWLTNTPAQTEILRYHHLHRLGMSLLDQPDRFVLAQPPKVELREYLRQHRGALVEFQPLTPLTINYLGDTVYWTVSSGSRQ